MPLSCVMPLRRGICSAFSDKFDSYVVCMALTVMPGTCNGMFYISAVLRTFRSFEASDAALSVVVFSPPPEEKA